MQPPSAPGRGLGLEADGGDALGRAGLVGDGLLHVEGGQRAEDDRAVGEHEGGGRLLPGALLVLGQGQQDVAPAGGVAAQERARDRDAQLAAGRAGIRDAADPGGPVGAAYLSDRPMLPRSLMEAVDALKRDSLFRSEFGDTFIDYITGLKDFEIGRFLAHVTDWEHREYFEVF